MKLLLTSAGIKNPSMEAALVGLLGKPIGECNALCGIPRGVRAPQGVQSRGRVAVHRRQGQHADV